MLTFASDDALSPLMMGSYHFNIDEAYERNINMDISLALLMQLVTEQENSSLVLRVATMEAFKVGRLVSQFFHDVLE